MSGFTAVLVAESRSELLKALRLPAFLLPVLAFPAVFYVLFGVFIGGRAPTPSLSLPAYMLATYGAFGVIGAALFGMGIGVAVERGQGWFTLKRATPMPPLAYFGAKVIMSMALAAGVIVLLAILAVTLGDVRLPAGAWARLIASLVLGAAPFCAMGCAIGFVAGPNSAPVIANLIYLPMSVASGLWVPLEFLPALLQTVAVWLPPYHLARLALAAVSPDGAAGAAASPLLHGAALATAAAVFLAIAVAAYRRGGERTWG